MWLNLYTEIENRLAEKREELELTNCIRHYIKNPNLQRQLYFKCIEVTHKYLTWMNQTQPAKLQQ
jgi:dTDP-glucose pyrophosphorylase